MHEPVKNGIGQRRLTDRRMPVIDWELTDHEMNWGQISPCAFLVFLRLLTCTRQDVTSIHERFPANKVVTDEA
ncbi:MAG: hypothetical protein P0120_04030 [Nitrospira sp.]|nr:hypothetical protein [Nitrospira sp.]